MVFLIGLLMIFSPLLMIYMLVHAIRFNKYFLMLLPLGLLCVLLIFNWDLIVQLWQVFMHRCVIWFVIALILSSLVSLKWSGLPRLIFCTFACFVACLISIMMANHTTVTPVFDEYLSQMKEATVYRHQGDGLKLNQEQIKTFQNLMSEVNVKEDVMEKSLNLALDDKSSWFCLETEVSSDQKMQIAFFQKINEPDLMRVIVDEKTYCYIGEDEKDLGGDWINEQISSGLRRSLLDKYASSLKELKDSFSIQGTYCSFLVPDGLPEDLEITIIGLPDSRNTVDYFLQDVQSWKTGSSYSFDVSKYDSYRYLYLSAKVEGESFDLVNIYELLPDHMKSSEAQDRFHDVGI